ncbi:MAG: hypothetical protein V7721_10520 [Porticoccaceae bacterium]
MKRIIIALYLVLSMPALATEFKPYPLAQITEREWKDYYEKVSEAFPNSVQDHPQQNLIVYRNDKERLSYAFTKVGHPAHPAWVTRQVVEANGTIDMVQIGYFAGKEEPFAVLFQQYQKLNDQMRAKFSANSK